MLDQAFGQVYTKFKLHFYKQIFSRFEDREATLTTVESFCMEVITALGEPTIAQFSHMMNLSTPNAAYKINSLVKKGYVERIRSTGRQAGISPAADPEISGLLQYQLFLPASRHGTHQKALCPRGSCPAGGYAAHRF